MSVGPYTVLATAVVFVSRPLLLTSGMRKLFGKVCGEEAYRNVVATAVLDTFTVVK